MCYNLRQTTLFIYLLALVLSSSAAVHASAAPYKTLPALPTITTKVITDSVSDGYVFITPGTPSNESLLILDNDGEPVYYQTAPDRYRYYDFKRQPDGSLTYIEMYVAPGAPMIAYQMDNTYTTINTFVPAGRDLITMDEHDIQILPNGNAMFILHDTRNIDMTHIGGAPNSVAIDNLLQEVDADNNLVFEWNSADYFNVEDSLHIGELAESNIDYAHGNSIEIDHDGNILFSTRNLSEITKIDHQTGEILWRMGGRNNEFTLIGDDNFFSFQHDARRVSADTITLFDNIWDFDDLYSSTSRVLEYRLDEVNKTVELIWEYEHPGGVWSHIMGNAQRLPNGNTMIGWGSGGYNGEREQRLFSEVSADGELLYDVQIDGHGSYRAFRFDWEGNPAYPPTLIAERDNKLIIDLYYSWNGATEVETYVLYGGTSPDALNLITTQQKDGFENSYSHIVATNETVYYQILPYDAEGNQLTPSDVIEVAPAPEPTAITFNTTTTSHTFTLFLFSIPLFFLYGGIMTQKIGRKR